jgi:hypothetical protein
MIIGKSNMFIKVKYNYITSLTNECFTIVSSSYVNENCGEKFIKSMFILETGKNLTVPCFLAERSLVGYVQSLYPNARITQKNDGVN